MIMISYCHMRDMKGSWRYFLAVIIVICAAGCGKYGKPRPPEDFAPAEVKQLAVTASVQGVAFNWYAPKKNNRGKDLDDLGGFRIYRRELRSSSRLNDPNAKFDLIGTVEDPFLNEYLEQKRQAIEQGQLSRQVRMDEEKEKFEFIDRTAVPGKSYYYQVVGFNQGGVEGNVAERINVIFRGEISEIARIPYSAEDFEF